MLVYGDATRCEPTSALLSEIGAELAAGAALPGGIDRHGRLVGTLIAAGELAQGVADALFEAVGRDTIDPRNRATMALVAALAAGVAASWRSGFAEADLAPARKILDGLAALALPAEVSIRRPEGFAFYAVYPEAFLEAAAPLRGGTLRVIGLRSIGTTLAAMVAAGASAGPPLTLRPVGHPFGRELRVSPELEAALLEGADRFAVVDEGPGLSGSSFGAVLELLQARGVARERIHLFPSHAGEPGPKASAQNRARWQRLQRHLTGFEDLLLRPRIRAHRLETWIADLVGPVEHTGLQEVSGGGWRSLRYEAEDDWPAADLQQERRKFLFRTERGTWLAKFVGLGAEGRRKADRAARLAAAGFSPDVAGWVHGFLVERWIEDARPLDPARCDRPPLLERVGRYLGFRARSFPARPGSGASLSDLARMARHNAAEALGAAAGAALETWGDRLAALEAASLPVEIDGRMHAQEWLLLGDGRLLKTDAVDHHAAHDLVGCQDIAWDIAGAAVEFDLSPAEVVRLAEVVGASAGRPVIIGLVGFMTLAYLAFQLGATAMAADAASWSAPEAARLRRASARYAGQLERRLAVGTVPDWL